MGYAIPTPIHSLMSRLTILNCHRTWNLKEHTELSRLPFLDPTIPIQFGCCQGDCGTCAIKVIEGEENLSPKTKQEIKTLSRLGKSSYRLACQCAIRGDVVIET